MTRTLGDMHGIDNDEQLFEFDPYEATGSTLASSALVEEPPRDILQCLSETESYARKGKGSASIPMPMRTAPIEHDLFDARLDVSASEPSNTLPSLIPPQSHCSVPADASQPFEPMEVDHVDFGPQDQLIEGNSKKGKGKERDQPPTLPPLDFSSELGYDTSNWPSTSFSPLSPGPSSYGSGYGSLNIATMPIDQSRQASTSAQSVSARPSAPLLTRMPSRRRSLSNLSTHSSRSLAARSMSGIKLRFGSSKQTGKLARKLLFKKREEGLTSLTRSAQILESEGGRTDGNCPVPWCGDFKPPSDSIISNLKQLDLTSNADKSSLPIHGLSHTSLRSKGRSNSSPFPLSALDLVFLPSPNDVFTPLPLVVRNYFDDALPREVRLYILQHLVRLHEEDHERAISEGTWSTMKASSSKGRWIGRNRGARELVKFSRVSRSWYKLTFDGQLWSDLDLRAFTHIPAPVLKRLAESGGRFIKTVDVSGHIQLSASTLVSMVDSFCLEFVLSDPIPFTQLTSVNLHGCSAVTTHSLHHLLIRSPSLQKLLLRGIPAVKNATFEILAVYCRQLTILDASRCPEMDAEGVKALSNAYLNRGEHMRLKVLKLSGLKYANDSMMKALGMAAPFLEVLDLSYCRQLHNSAIEAFVACGEDDRAEDLGVKTVVVPARDIGRESTDYTKFRRRVTRLRHLSLSSCILLTDTACANIAYSVPDLEFLELASIGASLKNDGLISLLNTTPNIRRLDVEDAVELSDRFLAAITPIPQASLTPSADNPPQPGAKLEHLIVSSLGELSDGALLSLVRNCEKLRVLEADNTHINSTVLKEFVKLSRQRQMSNAKLVAIDCRSVGESSVRSLAASTRPRLGWRAHEARRLRFLDARDTRDGIEEELKIGQDECDEKRVVIKTFYSWQTVDAVRADREKRRKRHTRRAGNASNGSFYTDDEEGSSGGSGGLRTMRWWSPSGRRGFSSSGPASPQITGNMNNDNCRIM